MKLSEKIIYLRKEKCWSQEQLATKLEVSRQAVYKWEADINQPDLDKLKRISHLFNVSYDILMDDDIDLPIAPNIVEVAEEVPEVEVIESIVPPPVEAKSVHNEVAVQINYAKEPTKSANKKLIALLCVLVSFVVVSLCVISYIVFGIVLQKDSYLVKFDTQGGTIVSDQVIKEGKEINSFTSPTKAGYTFDGWYLGEKKWDFEKDTVKSDTTLLAKWIPNRNTITYIDNESGERYESFASTDETVALSANTFKKDGHTFLGWATTPGGEVVYSNCASYKMGAENVALYAIWSSEHYKLVLNLSGGTLSSSAPSSFTSSDSVVLPSPSKNFYSFDGWYDSNNNKVEIIAKGTTGDIVLTARYTPITYNITYVLNGGTNNTNNPTTYDAEREIIFASPEHSDYSFVGWYLDKDFKTPIAKTALGKGGNITLYAKWEDASFSYMLYNGGYTVIGYSGNDTVVRIPSEYEGVPIIGVFGGAFYGNTEITEIIIPSTIESIDITAFDECSSLSAITVDSGNREFCSLDGVLYNKQKTVIHKYPMGKEDTVYVAPDSLDVINPYAFSYAIYLEEVYLPNDESLEYGVGKICVGAFEGCISLTTIELGYLPNYFEADCFKNCWSLESIEFKAETVWGIARNAFENCFLLADVIFNSTSVKEISNNAFMGCVSLESIELTNVEKLGTNVFEGCANLTEVYIPLSVTSVGSDLFIDCENLTVYCEATSKPSGWAYGWSTGAAEVIWKKAPTPQFITIKGANGLIITGCNYITNDTLNIPDTIDGITVKEIGANAFDNICDTVRAIIIPTTVTVINPTAFDCCTKLENISVAAGNSYYSSSNGVLYKGHATELVKYPQAKLDTSFSVPYTVQVIGERAFYNSNVQRVSLHEDDALSYGVSQFEEGAFENCTKLKSIELGYSASFFKMNCFKGCTSLEDVEFKCSVVWEVLEHAFDGCTSLKSIKFHNRVDYIGKYAFANCTALTELSLGEANEIADLAFKNAINLKAVFIPNTVTVIEGYAFSDCSNLIVSCEATSKPSSWSSNWSKGVKQVLWGQTEQPSEPDVKFTYYLSTGYGSTITITGCTGKGQITIPEVLDGYEVRTISANAFSGQNEITEIIIPASVRIIDITAFENCPALEKITYLGANTEFRSIDGVLFCDDGRSIVKYPEGKPDEEFTIPSNVDIIRAYAFKNNPYLKKVIFPSDVEGDNYVSKLEQGAFEGCTALTAVEGCYANYFDKDAFKNCTALKEITLYSEEIYFIMNQVFFNCSSLKEITFKGNVGTTGWQSFGYCTSLKNVTFEGTLGAMDRGLFEGCISLESFTIPKGVTVIESEAFKKCYNLKKIEIPSTVTTISKDAFLYSSLMYVNIPSTVTTIEDYAFSGIYDLFIFCEASEKPQGWGEKWNYSGENENSAPYRTYFGELYVEPTFEFQLVSGGSTHIEEIRNIKSKVLILPSMNGTSRITHLSLFETDLAGVEEIFISSWMGETYDVTWDFHSDLKAVYVATLNQNYSSVDGVLYSYDKSELIYYPRSKENSEYVAIKGLQTIKMNSFNGCKNLTSLVLYNDEEKYGVTKIENDSFRSCPKLSSIYFGKSITYIGSEAFIRCNALTSLEFTNEKPLTIGAYTFYECTGLENVSFKGANTVLNTYAFHLCENIATLDLTGVTSIGHCAFNPGANLKQVFIPATVIEMSSRAFDYPSVITFYCEPTERPSGWDEGWTGKTAFVTILWGQSGLPTN